jgi:hypothetical protein
LPIQIENYHKRSLTTKKKKKPLTKSPNRLEPGPQTILTPAAELKQSNPPNTIGEEKIIKSMARRAAIHHFWELVGSLSSLELPVPSGEREESTIASVIGFDVPSAKSIFKWTI